MRGQQLVNDAIFVMHVQAAVLAHHIAVVLRIGAGFAGKEPLDGHAQAAGDVEQCRNRRVGQVAFQLADVAGGQFTLLGKLSQGHAPAFAQAANARAEKLRGGGAFLAGNGAGGRHLAAVAHGVLRTARCKAPEYKQAQSVQATFNPS
ncbi:hypothetical protein D3C72_1802190 [compost metagenome]